MKDIFNYFKRLENINSRIGRNKELFLFILMINEEENNILKEEDFDFDLAMIIDFISYCISNKIEYYIKNGTYEDTRKHIIKALETFKKYGNAEITIDEFNKFMEVK